MVGISVIILLVGGFICFTANKKNPDGSPGYQRMQENRRFKSGPRQIYDPAKTNYKEDEVYFSGESFLLRKLLFIADVDVEQFPRTDLDPRFICLEPPVPGESQPLLRSTPSP